MQMVTSRGRLGKGRANDQKPANPNQDNCVSDTSTTHSECRVSLSCCVVLCIKVQPPPQGVPCPPNFTGIGCVCPVTPEMQVLWGCLTDSTPLQCPPGDELPQDAPACAFLPVAPFRKQHQLAVLLKKKTSIKAARRNSNYCSPLNCCIQEILLKDDMGTQGLIQALSIVHGQLPL